MGVERLGVEHAGGEHAVAIVDRQKRRDDIDSLLLAGLVIAVFAFYCVGHWWTGAVSAVTTDGQPLQLRYDLNSLTLEELRALPGVGLGTARKIVNHRTQIGEFRSVDQLSEVPGIGPSRLASLRSFLFVSGELETSDRKDVPANERPVSVASTVPAGGRPTESH